MSVPCRVIKVGGSLFDLQELPQRLRTFIEQQSPAIHVLVAGGRALCDLISAADERFRLDAVAADELAIRSMHVTAGLLAALLGVEEVAEFDALQQRRDQSTVAEVVVFNAARFIHREERGLPGHALPIGWQVTSDSIAARLAELLAAEELVLLKSRDGDGLSLEQLAAAGIVDSYFPLAAARCASVRVVNLRVETHCLSDWQRLRNDAHA